MSHYFSLLSYRDALKQLRLLGGITSALLLALVAIAAYFSYTSVSLMILYVWIVPILMGFKLLSFLWDQERVGQSSALADTDKTLFASSILAALTWTSVTLLIALVIRGSIQAMLGFSTIFSETVILLEIVILFGMLLPAVLFGLSVAGFSAAISGT
ncbi:MAG: hypothetical protein FWE48_03400, partial [Coriobacteriia bacterium]|nr:hypothetical protein [Coriobacteriia bacterium]